MKVQRISFSSLQEWKTTLNQKGTNMESLQEKLSRVRKPRVHITYQVETEGAVVEKSLPFVVGVLGNFSGDSDESNKPLKDRKFIQIDRDNFNEVMTKIGPSLGFKVKDTLKNDGSEFFVDLKFQSIEDFEPQNVINQVESLRNLLEVRNKLRDLSTKIDRSEELGEILEGVFQNVDDLQQLKDGLGITPPAANN